jgi:hypothetical protein
VKAGRLCQCEFVNAKSSDYCGPERWRPVLPAASTIAPSPQFARVVSRFEPSVDRKDKRGFDLISHALPFGALWYTKPDDAIEYAKFRSRSHDAVIRVYDEVGNVIEADEQTRDFKEW